MLALDGIAGGEFPVLVRDFDALEETPLLFVLGKVKKELSHYHTIVGKVLLKISDVREALFPDLFRDEFNRNFLPSHNFRMHSHDEGFLVIAAIENTYMAPVWKGPHAAPEIVVVEVIGGRGLERDDLATLRIDA